jgi:hypothetical protein
LKTGDEKYLIGFILGDGMLRYYHHSGYEVKITEKDQRHARYLAGLINSIYGVKPRLYRDRSRNAWRIHVYRKSIYLEILRKAVGYMMHPDAHLIGGLFDAEGDYTVSKKRLRFVNKDQRIANIVVDYLSSNGVNVNTYIRRRGPYAWFSVEIYGSHVYRAVRILDLRHPKWTRSHLPVKAGTHGADGRDDYWA